MGKEKDCRRPFDQLKFSKGKKKTKKKIIIFYDQKINR